MTARHRDPLGELRPGQVHIFVPAIMGAGLLVSAYTLLRDAWQARQRRRTSRRVALEGHAAAEHVLTGRPPDAALAAGLRPRASYLLTALAAGGTAVYVAIGSTYNYFHFGPAADLAWLWVVSLVVSFGFGAAAVAAWVMHATWPDPPGWLRPLLARTPLGQAPPPPAPDPSRRRPPLLLGWAAAATLAAAALFVFVMARAPYVFSGVDRWVERTAPTWSWAEVFAPLDILGRTHPAVLLALIIGVATLRCVPFALSYIAAVAAGLAIDAVVKTGLDRARPPGGVLAGMTDSFPSGHMVQATLIAGLLPLALLVITRRRWVAAVAGGVLGLAVVAGAVLRLHRAVHWWTDIVGGLLIGLALVLTVWWVLGYGYRHRRCTACPWSGPSRVRAGTGLVPVRPDVETRVRWASRVWLAAVVIGFVALTMTVGLPRNPEGEGLIAELEAPLQLLLLVLAGLGWLLSWRWEAATALLLAAVGNLLGVLAALAYQPLVSGLVAVAFLVPAVGFWLVWQHRRHLRTVAAVAVAAALVVAGSWVGGVLVYDHFYGPAHPASAQQALPIDRVVWSWSGGVTSGEATVVAQLVPGARQARLVLRGPDGEETTTDHATVEADQVVRLAAGGLAPDTGYRYAIEVDGQVDGGRGEGRFRTMPEGPSTFTVAVGACARTGSNGAVYDAIADLDPLLYLVTGDFHYGNPDRDDVDLFGGLYRRTLTAPAQAALYRSAPVAYVWDDHDYGPNDADASSPARPAARAAYRAYVPHYPLPGGPDGAIYQAFSAGRVRFVLTDTRSARTPESMLGEQQLAWLERELVTASRSHALVVWVNPDPWVAEPEAGADNWGGYPAERQRIADVIADHGVGNLVMLSGDAHMVAVDDGTHTDYSTAGEAGFPLLHAAALDRPGSVKGGPYSEGAYPGPGQFGTLTVRDDGGDTVEVELVGWNWRGERLVSYRTSLPVPDPVLAAGPGG